MISPGHLRAAARCWEHAGFFEDAAERFTTAEAWRDAGRCFSQAERHSDAALAYSRAGEPLLEAREHLMASWPERARSLYERLRSERWVTPSALAEVLLGLSQIEEGIRVGFTSTDGEAAARLARLASTRGRPDLAPRWWPRVDEPFWGELTPWNRWLRRNPPLIAAVAKIWPSIEITGVSLASMWEKGFAGLPSWGDRALDWSEDGEFFAAAFLDQGLVLGRIGRKDVQLKRSRLPERAYCARFLPASHVIVSGLGSGEVFLVNENGTRDQVEGLRMPKSVYSITFSPDGNRVAVSARSNSGALLRVSTWPVSKGEVPIEVIQGSERSAPLTAWSPHRNQLCWSPGPLELPNQLYFLGQPPLEAHADQITTLGFSSDGRFLFTTSYDKTMIVHDGISGRGVAPPERFGTSLSTAAVHPLAALIAAGEARNLHLLHLDPDTAPRLSRLSVLRLGESIRSLAFSPDGQFLLAMTGEPERPIRGATGHLHLFRVDLKP